MANKGTLPAKFTLKYQITQKFAGFALANSKDLIWKLIIKLWYLCNIWLFIVKINLYSG